MAFNPPSLDEITRRVFHRRDIAGQLAEIACGGQGLSTDRVTRIIRRELPSLLMKAVAIEAQRLADEATREELKPRG